MPDRDPMPDPMAKWTPAPDWALARIARAGWTARPVIGLRQALIGGAIGRAVEALAPGAPMVGLWQVSDRPQIVVRLGRDKALIVGGETAFEPGWHAEGFGMTPAGSAYCVFDIAGEAMRDVIAEATATDLDAGSPSAATLFAGIPAVLYRTASDCARLHVEAGFGPYVWRWLETRE